MALAGSRHPHRRTIIFPLLFLGSVAAVVFFGFYLIDWTNSSSKSGPVRLCGSPTAFCDPKVSKATAIHVP